MGIKYPAAIWDQAEQRWVSDAEVAEIAYTAFTSRRKAEHVSARLIVRRVKRLNPKSAPPARARCSPPTATTRSSQTPLTMLEAEASHRDHAILEQVIADLKDGPLAHLPSGVFTANAAWTVLAAMAFNLNRRRRSRLDPARPRPDCHDPPAPHRRPGRLATSGRRLRLHLPQDWPWEQPWRALHDAAVNPPLALAA